MPTKTAVVLLIGDELLSGRTTDKNLPVIAQKLGEKGIAVIEARVLPDNADVIVDTLRAWSPRVDYVLTTGGIGPTHDDITAASVAQAVNRPFVRHSEAEAALRAYYQPEELNEARLSMADMPQGADLIPNPVTGAPGFFINNIFVMAGVPSIMGAMLDFVVDRLTPGAVIHSQTLTTTLMEGEEVQEEPMSVRQARRERLGRWDGHGWAAARAECKHRSKHPRFLAPMKPRPLLLLLQMLLHQSKPAS